MPQSIVNQLLPHANDYHPGGSIFWWRDESAYDLNCRSSPGVPLLGATLER